MRSEAAWTETLHNIPTDRLSTVFPADSDASRSAARVLDIERRHIRRGTRREYLNMLRVSNCARALERLPNPDESFHIAMGGGFDAFDLVSAVLRLAAPATIRELNLATLGFNERNTATLLALLDDGQIGRCTFIASVYFRSMTDGGEIYAALHRELTRRGHRCAAIRSHAKIMLFELTDGGCLTWESSANLRSCRNVEQAVFTNDKALLRFHREWMLEAMGVE